MIHYHGLPITPETAMVRAVSGGHAFVSCRRKSQLDTAILICQSFAVDNGAFSAWKAGTPITDWSSYYAWVESLIKVPNFDFAIIPDVIDGNEQANDALLDEWPWRESPNKQWVGVPVWHLHESMERLRRLCDAWPRVAFGSSGEFATIGTGSWWKRISQAFQTICDANGLPSSKIHGLRMLDPNIFSKCPFSSVDSTNIGRSVGIDAHWKGNYLPRNKEARAMLMRDRIESVNGAPAWSGYDTGSTSLFDLL